MLPAHCEFIPLPNIVFAVAFRKCACAHTGLAPLITFAANNDANNDALLCVHGRTHTS